MQVIIRFFKDMSPVRLTVTMLLILIFLILFTIYISKINDDDYEILYAGLDLQDSAKVTQELDTKRINYIPIADGSTIKVHKGEVVKARLELAQVGLPTSGSVVGYEIFDKDDTIGATNFSQNVKLLRALEGELSRTIAAFEEIDKARVHLVMPQREIFSKDRMEPKASVVLKLKGNKNLDKSQVDAISHLVVTAVPGLDMNGITIVDTKGRALKIGAAEDGVEFAGSKNEEMKIAQENRLKRVIEDLLEKTIGQGKVKATVSLEMNFDRIVTNSEFFDPDGAVVRSVQSIDERDQTPVAGGDGPDASVSNNIPGGSAGAIDPNKVATVEKSESTTNYEISKTIKNHISESGAITRMSIGILVDGIYITNSDATEKQYNPRPEDDIEKVKNLVKVAVGFNSDRGDMIEVINMKFSGDLDNFEEDTADWIKDELPALFQTVVFAVVVLLVLITVIRPIALKAFEVKRAGMIGDDIGDALNEAGVVGSSGSGATKQFGSNASANEQQGEDGVVKYEEKSDNPIENVNKMAETQTQDLVNVLRKWLNEES